MSHGHEHGPECREIFARLSEFLDGELDAAMCGAVEGHLDDCPPCRAFLESLRRTVAILEALPGRPVPADVRRQVLDALRQMRRDADGGSAS
jgi:RNA polymerase sigma-70 factor (ECF subfamily)